MFVHKKNEMLAFLPLNQIFFSVLKHAGLQNLNFQKTKNEEPNPRSFRKLTVGQTPSFAEVKATKNAEDIRTMYNSPDAVMRKTEGPIIQQIKLYKLIF